MPWQEVTLKEQRLAFVQETLCGEKTLTAGPGLEGQVLGLVLQEGEASVWALYLGQERLSRLEIRPSKKA